MDLVSGGPKVHSWRCTALKPAAQDIYAQQLVGNCVTIMHQSSSSVTTETVGSSVQITTNTPLYQLALIYIWFWIFSLKIRAGN